MLLLLGLAVTVTACVPFVGNGSEAETPTPEVIPTIIRPTQETSVTPATSPVPTLVPLPTRAQQAATAPPSCTPRTDWPEYTVQAGDTLYSIALRSDSTQATLQAANCLSDPNKIFEGQSLRVPKQPEPREPAATPGASGATGDVAFTFIIVQNSATVDSERSYQALQDTVYLTVYVTNATSFRVLRAGDGRELGTGSALQGAPNAGGTLSFRKIDRLEGSNSLFFTVRATKRDGMIVESPAVTIRWP